MLPYPSTLFQRLGGHRFDEKVDDLLGYHQLFLTKDSSKVTASITLWEWFLAYLVCLHLVNFKLGWRTIQDYYLNGAVVHIDLQKHTVELLKVSYRSWIKSYLG